MMNVPEAVSIKIAELGRRLVAGEATDSSVGDEGAVWLRDHEPVIADTILGDWIRKRARAWIREAFAADASYEQLALPFPELHARLEVEPGITKHQAQMTLADWENCVAIYRNRRDTAETVFRRVERRYEQLLDLLDGDLTVADVMDALAADPTPPGNGDPPRSHPPTHLTSKQ